MTERELAVVERGNEPIESWRVALIVSGLLREMAAVEDAIVKHPILTEPYEARITQARISLAVVAGVLGFMGDDWLEQLRRWADDRV